MSENNEQPSPSDRLDAAWKTAVDAAYHGVVIDYGNDGRPEDDRWQDPTELAAKDYAITYLAARTGVPEGFVAGRISAAAGAHGYANHDEYLQPPDWNDMTDWYAGAEHYAAQTGEGDCGRGGHDNDANGS